MFDFNWHLAQRWYVEYVHFPTFLLFFFIFDKCTHLLNVLVADERDADSEEFDSIPQPCTYPVKFTNGRIYITVNETRTQLRSDDEIQHGTKVEFECDANHHLSGLDINICVNGDWALEAVNCEPHCTVDDITSFSYATHCKWDGIPIHCNKRMEPGTTTTLECLNGYANANDNDGDQVLECGENGQWNDIPTACEQICGQIPDIAADADADANAVMRVPYLAPWHAVIYRKTDDGKFVQKCGGTIVDTKAVVSAISCFWNASTRQPNPESEYRVAVGKVHQDFDDTQDDDCQVFSVDKIYYMQAGHSGISQFDQDLAVIILSNHIQYNVNVTPICLPTHDTLSASSDELGRIVHWNQSNNTLQSVDVGVQFTDNCDPDFVAVDIPADEKNIARTSDRGNGVAHPIVEYDKNIYYLRGMLTSDIIPDNCDTNSAIYRNILPHVDFINQRAFMHRIPLMGAGTKSTRSCKIAQVPANGAILAVDGMNTCQRRNDAVKSMQVIQYICLERYRLVGMQSNLCVNGVWSNVPPRCEEIIKKRPGKLVTTFESCFYFISKLSFYFLLFCLNS